MVALAVLALGAACSASRQLPIVIRDPVTVQLESKLDPADRESQWHGGILYATSGKNRCEVSGGFKTKAPLPDGGMTVVVVGDICVMVRCGAQKAIFGHEFTCDCRGEEVLDECFDDQDP